MKDLTLQPSNHALPAVDEFNMMKDMAKMCLASGFLPDSIRKPEQALVIILKGRELGIPPMQAFAHIAVIKGKPTMTAELMLALIFRNYPTAIVNILETDNEHCTLEAKRPGGKMSLWSFTMEDAKKANLTGKGPWLQYPANMCRARCISNMARAVFPDALMGVSYTPEELGADVDEEGNVKDVTPEAVETPAAAPAPEVEKPFNQLPVLKRVYEMAEVRGLDKDFMKFLLENLYGVERSTELGDEALTELLGLLQKHDKATLKELAQKNYDEVMSGFSKFASTPDPDFSEDLDAVLGDK